MPDRSTPPVPKGPAPFDGPTPFQPKQPGPPPTYVAPGGKLPRSMKRCIDCRLPLPRDRTHFDLKFSGDPYGLADRARSRLRRRLKREENRKPTKAELAVVGAAALEAGPEPGLLLQTQSICRRCHQLRHRQRRDGMAALEAVAAKSGAAVERGAFWRTAVMSKVPAPLTKPGLLEPLATAGVVLMSGGKPVLPKAPAAALRVCYAALLSPARPGALGPEGEALLSTVPKLVAKIPKHNLSKRFEDVRDVVLARECGPCAPAATDRLVARLWRLRQRKAQAMIKSGALDRFEASTRLLEGIHDAIISWDPLHESGAALKTHAFNRIGRALQLRGRKDYAIAAKKGDDGKWHGGAASLQAMLPPSEDGDAMVPHAVNYTAGNQAAVRVCAERRNTALSEAAAHDVSVALATLSDVDREIASRLWMSTEKVTMKQVSEEVGLDESDTRARAKQIKLLLGVLLADYNKAEV